MRGFLLPGAGCIRLALLLCFGLECWHEKLELNDFDAVVAAPFGAVGIKVEHDYLSGLRLMPQAQAEYCADQPWCSMRR